VSLSEPISCISVSHLSQDIVSVSVAFSRNCTSIFGILSKDCRLAWLLAPQKLLDQVVDHVKNCTVMPLKYHLNARSEQRGQEDNSFHAVSKNACLELKMTLIARKCGWEFNFVVWWIMIALPN